jgi:hypothetical protein
MLYLLLLLLGDIVAATPTVVQRINYGIVFQPQEQLSVATEWWLHTYEIKLPRPKHIPSVKSCHFLNKSCRTLDPILHNLDKINVQTGPSLNRTVKQIHTLLPQTTIPRGKRSILPFIGDLSKSLFGTTRCTM